MSRSSDADLAALIGRRPDPALLEQGDALLPQEVGRPAQPPPDPARDNIRRIGVTMAAASLIGGIVLMLFGIVAIVSQGAGMTADLALVIGSLLAGTHLGWAHLAEMKATRLEVRRGERLIEMRAHWLEQIEPYPRWKVQTEVGDDGSIEIQRIVHRPVAVGQDRFTFRREVEQSERHSGDEPGAAVAERAELMRRQAAADTAREQERCRAAVEVYRDAAMRTEDEQQRLAAVRAASRALSDQINANLSQPPLVE
jgi:hypothetical protein